MNRFPTFVLAILAALLVLTGLGACATGKTMFEPQAEDDLLVIGQIELMGTNWAARGNPQLLDLNGVITKGIVMILKNDSNEERRVEVSRKDGIFVTTRLGPGRWHLARVEYASNKNPNSYGATCWLANDGDGLISFWVMAGTVNNLGKLEWFYNGSNDMYSFEATGDHAEVMELFGQAFPESGWLKSDVQEL